MDPGAHAPLVATRDARRPGGVVEAKDAPRRNAGKNPASNSSGCGLWVFDRQLEPTMRSWQEELLHTTEHAESKESLFQSIEASAKALGFEHCAYGLRVPMPVSNPRTVLLNNYPSLWQARYVEAGYVGTDPTVQHARRTQAPLVWNAKVFEGVPGMWEEAQSFGLRFGWAKSNLDANGVGGMLTLARSNEALSEAEVAANSLKMCWLAHMAHVSLSRLMITHLADESPSLTDREVEVLKWTADGKTSGEIADILAVSDNTVNFHIKNAITKLRTANKTAAAVRAAMLGLFN
jgi:LuxR family quorum-sensing system transcriptional regulator SolR